MQSSDKNDRERVLAREVLLAIRESRQGSRLDTSVAEAAAKRISKNNKVHSRQAETRNTNRTASSYLRLIRKMLDTVRSGVSRNEFLASVFEELDDAASSTTRTILLLEAYPSESRNEISKINAPFIVGTRSEKIEEFRSNLESKRSNGFIQNLLLRSALLDFDLSDVLMEFPQRESEAYLDEFQNLRNGTLWICAIPLIASEKGEPERSLVALYDGGANDDLSGLPPGSREEWDVLLLIPEIFNLLQHRVQNMREQVDAEQRRLILELAPSAITHELGTSLGLMEAAVKRTPAELKKLAKSLGAEDTSLTEISNELVSIQRQILISRTTTEAFTNLERRNPRTKVRFSKIVDEIEIVLARRLQVAQTSIVRNFEEELFLETDIRYVTHVLMNVIINAIEAIEPIASISSEATSHNRYTIAVEVAVNEGMAEILIANDGPPIPVEFVARVLDKGITTKPVGVGHGQGLHLCRQVARHLGGSFGFGRPPSNLPEANVAFSFITPVHAHFEGDV